MDGEAWRSGASRFAPRSYCLLVEDIEVRIPVSQETLETWTALGIGFRFANHMVDSAPLDPRAGSQLQILNDSYPHEKAADWCRGYLNAAVEHLMMWADFAQPLSFNADHVVVHRGFRPAQTLARAAMESASQAVWMLSGGDERECMRRHLSLIRWDCDEHAKSMGAEEAKQARGPEGPAARLLERASGFSEAETKKPSHLSVLRAAADAVALDPDEVELLWRAASGSAHGRRWPALALQNVTPGHEYEPGQYRTFQVPDVEAMTRVLQCAHTFVIGGVVRYLNWLGEDVTAARERSVRAVGMTLPLRDGVDREDLLTRREGEF